MNPMLTTQLQLHLANGVVCQAPVEVVLVAILQALPPPLIKQIVANIEAIKGTPDATIVTPDGNTYIPFGNGAKPT